MGAGSALYLLASGSQDELSRTGGAAADGDSLRVEDAHKPCRADPEPHPGLFQDRDGCLVSFLGEPRDVLPEHLPFDSEPPQRRVWPLVGDLPRDTPDGGARGERLETAVVAASAAWTLGVDGDVPHLPSRSLGASQEHPVGDDPATYPGPKGYEDLVVDVCP